jgi:alpha-1,3-mannosyltransferase
VAEEAANALERSHGISVVGTHHGFFAAEEEDEIAAAIRNSGAQLVLVGMGNPRQEIWAARHIRAIKVPILCVGAFLDFSAGRISRAPALMRAMRLEWIYRLVLEPRRMAKRYVTGNLSFLFAVLCQRLAQGSHD